LKNKYLAGIGHHDDDPQTPDFWASAIGLTQAAMAVKTGDFIGVYTVRSSECRVVETMQGRIALVDARYQLQKGLLCSGSRPAGQILEMHGIANR
jgi:hypothetical protein